VRDRRNRSLEKAQRQPDPGPITVQQTTVTQQGWKGPLPPPASLAEFDEVVPGSAERIIRQFELESDHRRALERGDAREHRRDKIAGQVLAGLFALGALSVSAYAISQGNTVAATVIGGATVATVVIAFLRNKKTGS